MLRASLFNFATLVALSACQSNPTETTQPNTGALPLDADTLASQPAPSLASQFASYLQGVWIKDDYWAGLRRIRSPQQVFDAGLSQNITSLYLDFRQATADSLEVEPILNNHEGGTLTVYLKSARHANALPTNLTEYDQPGYYSELGYRLSPTDTLLAINQYNSRNRLVKATYYRRIRLLPNNSRSITAGAGIEQAAREAVMAGTFTGTDSANRPVSVRFAANGQVSGLSSFRQYDVNIDFEGGPETGLDMLFFDSDDDKRRADMHYRFSGDTLRLYSILSDTMGAPFPHRLMYTLKRR